MAPESEVEQFNFCRNVLYSPLLREYSRSDGLLQAGIKPEIIFLFSPDADISCCLGAPSNLCAFTSDRNIQSRRSQSDNKCLSNCFVSVSLEKAQSDFPKPI